MALTIKLVEGHLYMATATPPHVSALWEAAQPSTVDQIVSELRGRGCHQTDIGDAFYEADPDWLTKR